MTCEWSRDSCSNKTIAKRVVSFFIFVSFQILRSVVDGGINLRLPGLALLYYPIDRFSIPQYVRAVGYTSISTNTIEFLAPSFEK